MDSSTAADVLGITPEAYRQRLSRARKTVAEFLGAYCQHGGAEDVYKRQAHPRPRPLAPLRNCRSASPC